MVKKPPYKTYQELEQRSPEWFQVRSLHLTASHASTIAVAGKGLETYCKRLVLDHLFPEEIQTFTTPDMERGNLLEPVARGAYAKKKKVKVQTVGFLERSEHVGCSPDGLVGRMGGLEIKCPNLMNYLTLLLQEKINVKKECPDYYWQCQMNLLISGRKWWDLAFYNPHFKQSLIIVRITPDPEAFSQLEKGLAEGEQLIKQILKRIN